MTANRYITLDKLCIYQCFPHVSEIQLIHEVILTTLLFREKEKEYLFALVEVALADWVIFVDER